MERRVLEGAPLRDAHHAVAAESHSNSTAHSDPLGCDAYRTAGSANPDQTRRAAAELLASLQLPKPD